MTAREEAFRALYAAESEPLVRYVWQLVRDRGLAEELAQESFTRLYSRLTGVEQPRAYLYRVATNLVHDAWSRRRRDALLESTALDEGDEPDYAGAVAVRRAVGALPSRLRPVVLLHYYADLSVADGAAGRGRPEGTVKRQLSEARVLLTAALDEGRGVAAPRPAAVVQAAVVQAAVVQAAVVQAAVTRPSRA